MKKYKKIVQKNYSQLLLTTLIYMMFTKNSQLFCKKMKMNNIIIYREVSKKLTKPMTIIYNKQMVYKDIIIKIYLLKVYIRI
jgi:hypothetical protein